MRWRSVGRRSRQRAILAPPKEPVLSRRPKHLAPATASGGPAATGALSPRTRSRLVLVLALVCAGLLIAAPLAIFFSDDSPQAGGTREPAGVFQGGTAEGTGGGGAAAAMTTAAAQSAAPGGGQATGGGSAAGGWNAGFVAGSGGAGSSPAVGGSAPAGGAGTVAQPGTAAGVPAAAPAGQQQPAQQPAAQQSVAQQQPTTQQQPATQQTAQQQPVQQQPQPTAQPSPSPCLCQTVTKLVCSIPGVSNTLCALKGGTLISVPA